MDVFIRILRGFALGLVQGLTEFLPISSSGHLLLIEKLGVQEPSVAVNLFLHLATLLSVVLIFRKRVFEWIRHPFSKKSIWIYVTCIPTAIIGIIFKLFCEELLIGKYLSVGFLITAILLLVSTPTKFNPKPFLGATIVGIVQGLAILPGVSRSGSTITALTMMNYKEDAGELSFLMSIPVIVGGSILELKDFSFVGVDWISLLIAVITAFISGLFALKVMVKHFKFAKTPFAIYLLIVAVFNMAVDIYLS